MGAVWEDLPLSLRARKGTNQGALVLAWGHLAERGKDSKRSRGLESPARVHGSKDLCKRKECALESVACEQGI